MKRNMGLILFCCKMDGHISGPKAMVGCVTTVVVLSLSGGILLNTGMLLHEHMKWHLYPVQNGGQQSRVLCRSSSRTYIWGGGSAHCKGPCRVLERMLQCLHLPVRRRSCALYRKQHPPNT